MPRPVTRSPQCAVSVWRASSEPRWNPPGWLTTGERACRSGRSPTFRPSVKASGRHHRRQRSSLGMRCLPLMVSRGVDTHGGRATRGVAGPTARRTRTGLSSDHTRQRRHHALDHDPVRSDAWPGLSQRMSLPCFVAHRSARSLGALGSCQCGAVSRRHPPGWRRPPPCHDADPGGPHRRRQSPKLLGAREGQNQADALSQPHTGHSPTPGSTAGRLLGRWPGPSR